MAVVYFWATIWPLAASWVLNWSRWRGVVFILIFSWMSFFLFHILLLCLFCSTLIFPPNYDGPGWTQTDLNQPKRSWTSSESDITLCNLLAAFSENLFRLFWDRGLSQMTSATKGEGGGSNISKMCWHHFWKTPCCSMLVKLYLLRGKKVFLITFFKFFYWEFSMCMRLLWTFMRPEITYFIK